MPVRKMEANDIAACEKIQAIAFVSPFDAQAVDERLKKEGCPRDEYVGYENEEGTITACMVLPRYQMRYEGAWVPMVGIGGVETVLEIPLAPQEKSALLSSAGQLQEVIGHLELS